MADQGGENWQIYINSNEIKDLAVEGDYVWAATSGGVVRWNRTTGENVRFTTVDGLAHNDVRAVAIDLDGRKWFATLEGVSKFDGVDWTTYTTSDGLVSNSANCIGIGADGALRFGTWQSVVSTFDGATWTTYTADDGLADDLINDIVVDHAGHLWFGTNNGISEYTGPMIFIDGFESGDLSNWSGSAPE